MLPAVRRFEHGLTGRRLLRRSGSDQKARGRPNRSPPRPPVILVEAFRDQPTRRPVQRRFAAARERQPPAIMRVPGVHGRLSQLGVQEAVRHEELEPEDDDLDAVYGASPVVQYNVTQRSSQQSHTSARIPSQRGRTAFRRTCSMFRNTYQPLCGNTPAGVVSCSHPSSTADRLTFSVVGMTAWASFGAGWIHQSGRIEAGGEMRHRMCEQTVCRCILARLGFASDAFAGLDFLGARFARRTPG